MTVGCLAVLLGACATVPEGEVPVQADTQPTTAPSTPGSDSLQLTARPDGENAATARLTPQSAILAGTGQFVDARAARKPAPATPTAAPSGNGLTLNFEGVSIRDVVKVIFDALKENYVIDPQVQGEVTVQTSRPLMPEQLLPTLETLLRASNAVLVQEAGVYRIIPVAGALQQGNLTPRLQGSAVGYGVRIVPLNYVSPLEMQTIIAPLMPEGAILRADPARNLLMLAGTPQELNSAQDTIDTFDVNWLKGMSIGIFRLRSADSQVVATELNQLLGESSGTPIAGLVRLIALSKLNAVLVISSQKEYLKEVGIWIERLDGIGSERLYVYQVQHSRADYLAELLNGLFNLGGGGSASRGSELAPGLRSGQLTSGAATSSGLSGGASSGIGSGSTGGLGSSSSGLGSSIGMGRSPTGGATGTSGSMGTSRVLGGGAAASSTAEGGRSGGAGISGIGSGGPSAGMEEVRIVADPDNNSLLIWATSQNHERIIGTLEKMDVSPRQVLIEATFVEVSLSGQLKYGVQWFFNNDVGSNRQGNASLGLSDKVGLTSALSGLSPGQFSYAITGSGDIVKALLRALAADSKVKVLSSPQVMVLDNQQATIEVGQSTPIPQGTTTVNSVSTSGGVTYKDTGVRLKVLPRINAGGMVSMEIEQSVSEPGNLVTVGTSGDDEAPVKATAREFTQRTVDSKVVVENNQTLVLGGLIREKGTEGQEGIPGLRSIPVLGSLFSTTTQENDRTELIVLITPRVVKDSLEATRVTDEIKRKMQAIAPMLPAS
ncbi:MAG TPA: type II secretion system protein GspD [Gammaproteobacteria bacterium]|nr:type II secretion system protein GspD [Gammaproteobacteria bacterium]